MNPPVAGSSPAGPTMKNKYLYIITLSFSLFACSNTGSTPQTSTTSSTTVTLPEKPVVIAAVGDVSCSTTQRQENPSGCQDKKVAQLIASQEPDHVFILGDIQYNSGSQLEYNSNFIPIWDNLISIMRPVLGNHDLTNGSSAFYSLFPDIQKPGYYFYDISDRWRLFALNTNDECQYVKCNKGSDQYNWFESELQKSQNLCKIVIQHHPRYSSGVHGENYSTDDLDNLAQQYNVSIVLAAHDHHYERFNTTPVRYVVGTGGKELRSTNFVAKDSSFILDNKYGSLMLQVYSKYVNAYFISIDHTVYDYQTISCKTP